MPARDFEGVFYVKCPPEIIFEDDLYHVGYNLGPRARVEIVMSRSTFNKAMLLAEGARAEDRLNGAARKSNVARLRPK